MYSAKKRNPFSFSSAGAYAKSYNKTWAFQDSNLQVVVEDYNYAPTVVFKKPKGFISLSESEFYDLSNHCKNIRPHIALCKKEIKKRWGGVILRTIQPESKDEAAIVPQSVESKKLAKAVSKAMEDAEDNEAEYVEDEEEEEPESQPIIPLKKRKKLRIKKTKNEDENEGEGDDDEFTNV